MSENNYDLWGTIGNNTSYIWLGYCLAIMHFVPTISFWALLGYVFVGIAIIWVVCFILDLLTTWIKNR